MDSLYRKQSRIGKSWLSVILTMAKVLKMSWQGNASLIDYNTVNIIKKSTENPFSVVICKIIKRNNCTKQSEFMGLFSFIYKILLFSSFSFIYKVIFIKYLFHNTKKIHFSLKWMKYLPISFAIIIKSLMFDKIYTFHC